MSEETGICVEILDNSKDISLSPKEAFELKAIADTLQKMSTEIVSGSVETPDQSGSTEISSEQSDPSFAKCESIELDSTKAECVNKTCNGHGAQVFSVLEGKNYVNASIENIRKAMEDNDVLLEKSLKISESFLKNFTTNSELSTTSLKQLREYSGNDTLFPTSDVDSEDSFEVKSLLANPPPMSSGYCTSGSSTSVTPQSTAESNDSAERSTTSDLASRKRSGRSDSLETLVTDRSPSTIPWRNITNSFLYSVTTKNIRKLYDTFFGFKEFKNACSLRSNEYSQNLNIKYISLPLSRFLMEDILDFVDFLNGTGIELRESKSIVCPCNPKDVKLAYVREYFEFGVQQTEYQTIRSLLEELQNYNLDQLKTNEAPTNPDEISNSQSQPDSIESRQGKVVSHLEIVCKGTNSSKKSSKAYQLFSLETYRIMKLEPEIEKLGDPFVAGRLQSLNEEIRRQMIRCITDTSMVIEICINTKYSDLEKNLRKYFPEIEILLHRLALLREDCRTLLGNLTGPNHCALVLQILKVKIQIASALQKLLLKFSEINSEFLEYSHF